jgi:hypothetical protein
MRTFTTHLQQKLAVIPVHSDDIHQFLTNVHTRLPPDAHAAFALPITEEELKVAVRTGKRNKAPGIDSLLYNGYRVYPGGRKRPGRGADHPPPSSAEV